MANRPGSRPASTGGWNPRPGDQDHRPSVLHVRVIGDHGGGPDKTILRSPSYAHASTRMAAAYIHPRSGDGIDGIRQQADRWECPLHLVPERHGFDPRTASQLLQLCRQLRVDIWHAHDYKSNLLGLMLRRLHPMRLVSTAHGWVAPTPRLWAYQAMDHRLLRHYDHVLAVSTALHADCLRYGVPDQRLTYVPNAIEPHEHRRMVSLTEAKRKVGASEDTLVIGCVSRLSVEKRLDRAVRLLNALHPTEQRVELHIVGDGPCLPELKALAQTLGLEDRVRFHGWQSNTQPFFEAMDLLLMTSDREGLPNTLLEAMTLGVPVASTNVGGISDLLDGGRCGVLLPTDTSDWPDRLLSVLTVPQVRDTLIERGRQRILQRFTFATRMQRVVEIYRNVLGEKKTLKLAA